MEIQFVDLHLQYQSIKKEIDRAINEVIENTSFIGGDFVKKFEKDFSNLIGIKHCIGVANGTDAIFIALKMLGVGPGDEVITVCNSWISTSEAISLTGAKPVFVDIDNYFLIDDTQIEDKINKNTKAILPVHLYGQPANIKAIKSICEKFKLYLIEDCAQAHLAQYEGKYVGTFGDIATFSFFPGKNLGAYGDAGCIVTNNEDLAVKCRMFANHGALNKHEHKMEGLNSRLDALQANILNAKMPYIEAWTNKRIDIGLKYNEMLSNIKQIETPKIKPNVSHAFHIYAIKTKQRDELKNYLKENNIHTGIHYPTILPLLPAYNYLNYNRSDFPNGSQTQNELLSLPIFPELDDAGIDYIVKKIRDFY